LGSDQSHSVKRTNRQRTESVGVPKKLTFQELLYSVPNVITPSIALPHACRWTRQRITRVECQFSFQNASIHLLHHFPLGPHRFSRWLVLLCRACQQLHHLASNRTHYCSSTTWHLAILTLHWSHLVCFSSPPPPPRPNAVVCPSEQRSLVLCHCLIFPC
jgi:hypothetical protein